MLGAWFHPDDHIRDEIGAVAGGAGWLGHFSRLHDFELFVKQVLRSAFCCASQYPKCGGRPFR